MSTDKHKEFYELFDKIIGRFYEAYALRWAEQKLTGKIDLRLNFFKGALSRPNVGEDTGIIRDNETVDLADFENEVKFSELK